MVSTVLGGWILSGYGLTKQKGWLRKATPDGAISDQIKQLNFHGTEDEI
jgi:hypothetical protein